MLRDKVALIKRNIDLGYESFSSCGFSVISRDLILLKILDKKGDLERERERKKETPKWKNIFKKSKKYMGWDGILWINIGKWKTCVVGVMCTEEK